MPRVPQELRFHLSEESGHTQKVEQLAEWLQNELRPCKAVLVLCAQPRTAKDLSHDKSIASARGGRRLDVLLDERSADQNRWLTYTRFVQNLGSAGAAD